MTRAYSIRSRCARLLPTGSCACINGNSSELASLHACRLMALNARAMGATISAAGPRAPSMILASASVLPAKAWASAP